MKSKNMALMVVAIGCGLVAAFLTAKLSGGSGPEMVDVIVAKKELPVGTVLDEKELDNFLSMTKMPKGSVPPDIINNQEELKGKRVNRTLKIGNYFAAGDVGADSGIKIPEGMFKYAIKTDGVKAVAGFLQPGDRVDVLLTEATSNGKAKTGYILRNMLVLAVDTASRRREGTQEAVQQVNSVSLAVTEVQTQALSSAEKRGEVKFVLRDAENKNITKIEATDKIPGFDEETKTQAAAAPPKTLPVIVAKAEVPVNTFIDKNAFDKYFESRELPESAVPGRAVTDPTKIIGKYVVHKIIPEMHVFFDFLGDDKLEAAKPVEQVKAPDPVQVPVPVPTERPLYPRKFEQIINNQRVLFLETAPGSFRRIDGDGGDLKDLPPTGTIEKKQEKNAEPIVSDRPV